MTREELDKLAASGKIKGWNEAGQKAAKNAPVTATGASAATRKKYSKQKQWIKRVLKAWAFANGQYLSNEHEFHPERDWRFDHALVPLKVAFEYEGIFSEKSRHTTAAGYTGDADKYNAAQALGWKVYRYTAKNYKSLPDDLGKLAMQ